MEQTAKEYHVQQTSQWWDGYIVRYAVGTVTGAMCVYFILHLLWPEAKALWLMQPNITAEHIAALETTCKIQSDQACIVQAQLLQDLYGFNFAQLALLGIYGLAFTYIASAPVLVMHAVRRNTFSNNKQKSTCSGIVGKVFLWTVLRYFLLIGCVAVFFFSSVLINQNTMITIFIYLILAFSGLYILLQIFVLYCEYSQVSYLLEYYKKVHKARQSKCIDINSYKHLREHGNAFLLVIHNIIFLAVIFSIAHTFGSEWVLLIVLWIFPASGVYLLGHKIEAAMAGEITSVDSCDK